MSNSSVCQHVPFARRATIARALSSVALAVVAALLIIPVAPAPANALESRFGCYRVTAATLNVRKSAWGRSDILATVRRGELVAKRRRFCALRGFWCPIRTKAGIRGWVDKRFVRRARCR